MPCPTRPPSDRRRPRPSTRPPSPCPGASERTARRRHPCRSSTPGPPRTAPCCDRRSPSPRSGPTARSRRPPITVEPSRNTFGAIVAVPTDANVDVDVGGRRGRRGSRRCPVPRVDPPAHQGDHGRKPPRELSPSVPPVSQRTASTRAPDRRRIGNGIVQVVLALPVVPARPSAARRTGPTSERHPVGSHLVDPADVSGGVRALDDIDHAAAVTDDPLVRPGIAQLPSRRS